MNDLTIEAVRDLLAAEIEQPQENNEASVDAATTEALKALTSENALAVGDGADDSRVREKPSESVARSFDEGSVGLGVDIVEIERMASILKRTPAFAKRVFSPAEQQYCNKMANPATHYALRFAAKEAVVKAFGTGLAEGIGVLDIEVERAQNGRPSIKLSGRALEVANELGIRSLSISLSYTRTDAVACAMAVTNASIKASEKRKDPMEELARQFKETRGILDEL